MKKTVLFFLIFISTTLLQAQPPGRPDQPRHTIPKEQILKPQTGNIKLYSFEQLLDDAGWNGTRTWFTDAGAVVDSVTMISFFLQSKQATWTKRGWEYTATKPGSYTVTNNRIVIQFSYFPYTHYMEGIYDATTKKITGTFREERAAIRNPPPAYQIGTTTGTFVFTQK